MLLLVFPEDTRVMTPPVRYCYVRAPYVFELLATRRSRGEAPGKGQQQPRRAVNPNLSRYQSPNETGFLAQKT